MAWSGLDQRGFPRVEVSCDIWIHEDADTVIKAHTQNVGLGGVCVILDEELDKLSRVRIRVPGETDTPTIECSGRVVWIVKSTNPASGKVTFDTGIEFVNLKDEDKAIVEQLTKDHPPA